MMRCMWTSTWRNSTLAEYRGRAGHRQGIQRIEAPTSNFYLGQGKVRRAEGHARRRGRDADAVRREPHAGAGLKAREASRGAGDDRTEVILDIFATRARSSEAKLQVELAQLELSCCRG